MPTDLQFESDKFEHEFNSEHTGEEHVHVIKGTCIVFALTLKLLSTRNNFKRISISWSKSIFLFAYVVAPTQERMKAVLSQVFKTHFITVDLNN